MLTVVFDVGSLITACRFESQGKLVVDYLLSGCNIVIAPSVEEEVAVRGASYPDSVVAGERIVQGLIQVVPVAARKWARHLAGYALVMPLGMARRIPLSCAGRWKMWKP